MSQQTQATWRQGMAFEVEVDGHRFTVDAAPEQGGAGLGPKPKPLVLAGLAGCTGMDVVSILQKGRMKWDTFTVGVEGELSEAHPKIYRRIKIVYTFTGAELDAKKIERAVRLSRETYCGVSEMLRHAAEISHEIRLNP